MPEKNASTVAFTIGYLLTGSVLVGGTLALVEPACNTVAYHFHEKTWARLAAKRQNQRKPSPAWLSLLGHAH